MPTSTLCQAWWRSSARGSMRTMTTSYFSSLSATCTTPSMLMRCYFSVGSGRCHHCRRALPSLAAAAANHVPARCQSKKRAPFPAWAMRTPQFVHASLPIVLRLSISHTNVSHFFGTFYGMITLYTSHRSYLRRSPRLCKGRGSGCALFLHYCYHTASFSSGLNNVAMKPYVVFFCP